MPGRFCRFSVGMARFFMKKDNLGGICGRVTLSEDGSNVEIVCGWFLMEPHFTTLEG